MQDVTLDALLTAFSEGTDQPANFLGISKNLTDDLKLNIKRIYDFTKREEAKFSLKLGRKSLKNLLIENFDFEQIWQQIELQNDDVMDIAVKDLSNVLVAKHNLIFKQLSNELVSKQDDKSLESDDDGVSSSSSYVDLKGSKEHAYDDSTEGSSRENEGEEDETATNTKTKRTKQKGSIVDDDFFKLSEMEEFLKNEEQQKAPKESNSESDNEDEGSIDLFEGDSEASEVDEAKTARFKDYFVAQEDSVPKRKTNRLMQELEADNSDNEADDNEELYSELKSALEHRQERLKRKIEDLESQAISEKPWQLKGEVTAENRPQNSLLEEIVEFDLTSRPAPVITEQTSLQLEDIILQRIKHKTFDSVEKKSRSIDTPLEFKKRLVLDQEKSKVSLANIYEKEFLEQQAALDKDKMDKEEEEPETHKEIKKMMRNLFTKLDALSNFHFTSTPAMPELKIINNLPAVNMEEVAPVSFSDAALLAPEEIRNKPKGDIIGKDEKSSTDKKRERRKKKLKQKIHSKRKSKIDNLPKKNRIKT